MRQACAGEDAKESRSGACASRFTSAFQKVSSPRLGSAPPVAPSLDPACEEQERRGEANEPERIFLAERGLRGQGARVGGQGTEDVPREGRSPDGVLVRDRQASYRGVPGDRRSAQ